MQQKTQHITLDEWQDKFLKVKGDKILCCGRQVGKSEICSIDAAEYAINNPKTKPIVMIAPTERQAYGLFDKTLQYLAHNYPKYIKKGKDRPTKSRIMLKSGVQIYCLPVGKSGLGIRFLTIGRLYVDEASRVPEDVWSAIEPALLTTGGSCIYLSTPAGAVGEFFEVWTNKDNAYESFTRFSITSETVIRERHICNTWTEDQRARALLKLEQAKKRKSQREYAQEYLGEFIADLHRWFTDDIIEKCCIMERPEIRRKQVSYYLGVDVARMGDDDSTFQILHMIDPNNIIQVENIVTSKTRTTQTEEKILELNEQYDEIEKIYLDAGSGSLGVGILDMLLRRDETKRKVVAINNRARSYDKDDKYKAKILKEDLYGNLLALMEQNKIKLLDDPDLKASLRSVQYEYVMKEGQETKLRIFGNYTHIVEGLIRAAWCVKEKSLSIWIKSIKL